MKILKLLSIVFLSGSGIWPAIEGALFILGAYAILKKCGETPWHALIPCYREYAIGKCAGREYEGRCMFILECFSTVTMILNEFLPEGSSVSAILSGANIALGIMVIIFFVRIYLGLSAVFNRKRRWVILWVLLDGPTACLWGFSKKFQPEYKVEDFEAEAAQYFSGARAKVLDNGLTVNLDERTARDFFKTKKLLSNINLYIEPGHMVLLLGGSGAGKTTFVNAVNGYEKAKAEVVLNGSNVYSDYKKMQYDIGFVPQQDLMRGSDTVLHTLLDAAMLRLPQDFSNAQRRERVEEVMVIFGLMPVKDSLVNKLSGGQRKRLSISMEFISNPSLFILDEPDSGLDGVMARELMSQLRAIADQGKIVMVITHTPDRVIDLFDDVIVLAKDGHRTGRLAWFGPVAAAKEFFGKDSMEKIVKSVNRKEEGGEGRADEFIMKYAEVQHA